MTSLNEGDDFGCFLRLHSSQLSQSGVPEIYWKTIYYKLKLSIFDAGEVFSMLKVEDEDEDKIKWKVIVSNEDGINYQDPNSIYLIDHAWTYQINSARKQLSTIPGLLNRLIDLMNINYVNEKTENELIEEVMEEMWKYNQTYQIGNVEVEIENRLPIWYIMDEFGSRIQHSDTPTFRVVPFYYTTEQIAFSFLFPLKSLKCNDEVTRDYIEGTKQNKLHKDILKIPWYPLDLTNNSYRCEDLESVFERLQLGSKEILPNSTQKLHEFPTDRPLRVYSQYLPVIRFLNDPRFEITDTEDSADILWYTYHFKNFKELSEKSPNKLINQFPFENLLTVKDLLSVVAKSSVVDKFCDDDSLDTYPLWLPTTFDLLTELPQFVSYFQHRERKKMDNTWICKPWNLARSLDIHITNNLNYILRLPFTGPKIACKYIENPVLYFRSDINASVKFDIRYVVLLRSVNPLKLYVYNNFFLRFANKAFSLDHFDDYTKHFTVMNYVEDDLYQVTCDKFIPEFERQYPNYKYSDVEVNIFKVLKEIFTAATLKPPPKGIAHNVQSRAVYAVDLMLEWNKKKEKINCKLLEINWMPDCQRACDFYPDFYKNLFAALFLDEIEGNNIREL